MNIITPPHNLVSKPVEIVTDEMLVDIDGMKELLKVNRFENNRTGLAIAHCQVSTNPYQIFVIQPRLYQISIFINPKILSKSGYRKWKEGCLSFPDKPFIEIERAKKVEVEYRTLSGEEYTNRFTGQMALIIQHEIEHFGGKNIYGA